MAFSTTENDFTLTTDVSTSNLTKSQNVANAKGLIESPLENGETPTKSIQVCVYYDNRTLKYKGQSLSNKPDGYGEYFYRDGSVYSGDWKNGRREGFGQWRRIKAFNFEKEEFYIGHWQSDFRHGYGVEITNNGRRYYEGSWEKGLRHGWGRSGDEALLYEGSWVSGKQHGIGVELNLKTGSLFDGMWENGHKCGNGHKFTNSKEGTLVFEGHWAKGYMIKGVLRGITDEFQCVSSSSCEDSNNNDTSKLEEA